MANADAAIKNPTRVASYLAGGSMQKISRSLGISRTMLFGIIASAGLLAACSEAPRSLADYIAAICAKPFRAAPAEEAPYLAENVSAMSKMMIDMGIRPSGDVDTDFVAMMIPHHQGAIEMAQAELRYGHNEPLRRMAQEIIVTQLQEITAMHLTLGQPLPSPIPAPDQVAPIAQIDQRPNPATSSAKEP
jgi:hypothetical protein